MLTNPVLTEARTEGGHILRIEANARSVGTVLLDCDTERTGSRIFIELPRGFRTVRGARQAAAWMTGERLTWREPNLAESVTLLASVEQINAYLRGQGLEQASTGGGFSAWILPAVQGVRRWQIAITNTLDTADLRPGMPLIICLESPDGVQCECEDLASPDSLHDALTRFVAIGRQQFD